MRHLGCLVLLGLGMLCGCTNVAGDHARLIARHDGTLMETAVLVSRATAHFSEAGYDCGVDSRSELRCRKDLRDLYIHQTHAVVEVFQDGDAGNHLLVTTRWDEGLIPGEFISSQFDNRDVAEFCASLDESGQGICQILE